jgi:hypothetical protein
MSTTVKYERNQSTQKVAAFTGEGAYHGSTKTPNPSVRPAPSSEEVAEVLPSTVIEYWERREPNFASFAATFPNEYEVVAQLPVPTQEEIQRDEVTFCWATLDDALQAAGPLTKSVLVQMKSLLEGRKRFVYIDSKIQLFQKSDLPVDSCAWHVDGTIVVRDQRAKDLGYELLHDMKARLAGPAEPPRYLAYQSSLHCATQFVTGPVTVTLPECITNFDQLDRLVCASNPNVLAQPAGSIVRFDGRSLHRPVHATEGGWRLWIRCVETDREIKPSPTIINCYGTVFRSRG